VEQETPDSEVAYARFAPTAIVPYADGWLPG
jgi:hypothetical protein